MTDQTKILEMKSQVSIRIMPRDVKTIIFLEITIKLMSFTHRKKSISAFTIFHHVLRHHWLVMAQEFSLIIRVLALRFIDLASVMHRTVRNLER